MNTENAQGSASTSTLVAFLTARLDEDETMARAATPGPWWKDDDTAPHYGEFGWYVLGCPAGETEDSDQGRADATFIARHDPARVLREVAAKRAVLAALEHERQRKDIYNRDYPLGLLKTDGDLRARLSSNARWAGLEAATRALAMAYSGHPDYNPEWRA